MAVKRTPHTGAPRGKRVSIMTHSGNIITGKFHERTDRAVELADGTIIQKKDIKSFKIVRNGNAPS